jgi:hypothetical protein
VPRRTIGGDFALDWHDLQEAWEERHPPLLFATGRDALVAIMSEQRASDDAWLVPDFICPVVALAIRECGFRVQPYPWLDPWTPELDELERLLTAAAGIVVPSYMGLPPSESIWEVVAGKHLCVIEDRCQCIGPPPARMVLRGDYAIGSFRKSLPLPDGAYCVKRVGEAPVPNSGPRDRMVGLRLGAALAKQAYKDARTAEACDALEKTYVNMFFLGEQLPLSAKQSHRCSRLSSALIYRADMEAIASSRIRNQAWLAAQIADNKAVRIWEPVAGAIRESKVPMLALPVRCQQRDLIRKRLAAADVFCAVHWQDGDWSGGSERAAHWAASELSLPIDQRYQPDDLQRIVDALA